MSLQMRAPYLRTHRICLNSYNMYKAKTHGIKSSSPITPGDRDPGIIVSRL
jgi:hypothetical protein